MKIRLVPGGPLDVAATLARFHLWGEDPANQLGDGVFRRALRHRGRLVAYEARWRGPVDDVRLEVEVPVAREAGVRAAVVEEVRKLFGLGFDLPAFYRFAKRDPVLRELIGPLYGLRPTLTPEPFENLVVSITAQQVNLTFASSCRSRLVRKYGEVVPLGEAVVHAFPEAMALARARPAELRALQYSTRKAEYIRDLARDVASGTLDLAALAQASNDDVVGRLTAVRGLGRWTAEWFLARWGGRGDVCPAGDLAVRKAFQRFFAADLDEAGIRAHSARWGAYQNLAVHYLLTANRARAGQGDGGSRVSKTRMDPSRSTGV